MESKKAEAYRRGLYVFIFLAVMTIVEYFVGISIDSTLLLFVLALIKAAAVVQYFMNIARLWREESH